MTAGDSRGRALRIPERWIATTSRAPACAARPGRGGQSSVQLSGGSPPCSGRMPGGRTLDSGSAGGHEALPDTDAFEFPGRKTPHMQVVLVHGVFSAVTLELKLKSRLVAAHGFTAHRAGCTHPRSAPHAVRPSRRQPPAADRVSGFFAKDGFVRNCRGSQSHGRRSEPDATRPDARVRHLGARWKAIQRTPHRKVALPVGVREREPGTVSACSTGAHEPRSVGRSQPGGYA